MCSRPKTFVRTLCWSRSNIEKPTISVVHAKNISNQFLKKNTGSEKISMFGCSLNSNNSRLAL